MVKNGNFIGGIIMPGLGLQLKSLYSNASKLPFIEIENINQFIGNDTKSCILSGVINGTACALDGLIEKCKKELGKNTMIIGTGGSAKFLSEYMTNKFDIINPNLTLEGLYYVRNYTSAPISLSTSL
jgi:type III pantothenate kinase